MDTIAEYEAWKAGRQDQSVNAANVVLGSVEDQPDAVAGDLHLAHEFAKTTGGPVPTLPVVKEFRPIFQQAIERERAKTALGKSPVLAEWLRNPENAAVARDDLDGLSWWEGMGRGVQNTAARAGHRLGQMGNQLMLEQTAGRAADRQKTFGQLVDDQKLEMFDMQGNRIDTGAGPIEYLGALANWIDARYADVIGTDDAAAAQQYGAAVKAHADAISALPKSEIARGFEGAAIVEGATLGQAVTNFAKAFLTNPFGGVSWALETAGESAPQLAAALGVSLATRNPAASLATLGAGSYATERYTAPAEFLQEMGLDLGKPGDIQRLIADPKLLEAAADRGAIRGLVIAAFDLVSGGIAGRALAGNPIVEAVAQTVSQGILGAAGEYNARLAAGQDVDWNEVIAEGFAEMATTPVDMGVAGHKLARQRRAAKAAEDQAGKFAEISATAQASKLRERMPDRFRQFVEAATANGPVENVYVPADQFATYFQSLGVDPFALVEELDGMTRDDLEIALAGGGDLRIPTATYAAKIAGSEHDAFLIENMRFDPDQMTAAEAAEFNEKAQDALNEAWEVAEAERLQEEGKRSFEQEIFDTMVSRLRSAGRATDVATTEAQLYPAFYRVMAERSGMTIDEFAARYPLPQVEGDRPAGMQLRDTDTLNRTLAEARNRRAAGLDRRQSLLEFIADHGGINDVGGELRARNARVVERQRGRRTVKLKLARGSLAGIKDMFGAGDGRKFGVDDVAQAAIEAGYLSNDPVALAYKEALRTGSEAPDISAALWAAVDRELAGDMEYSAEQAQDPADVERDAMLDEIEAYLSRLGVDLDDDDATIRAAVEADQASEGRRYGQAAHVSKDLGIWRGKLRDLARGKLPDSADLRVGNVPAVLRALGVRAGQMVFRAGKVRKVMREHADIGDASLQDLPALLADPALVYEETTKNSDMIVVTDNVSASGAPIVVAIKSEGVTNNDQRATVVLTVYPLDRGNEKLAEVKAAGRILYMRDEKVGARFELTGANSLKGLPKQPPGRRPERKILSAAEVFKGGKYEQSAGPGPRGSIQFPAGGVGNGSTVVNLFQSADLSTFLHESGHYFLTVMRDLAERGEVEAGADFGAVKAWWGENAADVARDAMRVMPDVTVTADDVILALADGGTGDVMLDAAVDVGMQEQFARAFETYLMEGKAPSTDLRTAFEKFRAWLMSVYRRLTGLNVNVSDDLRRVFDRMLATDEEIAKAKADAGDVGPMFDAAAMGLTPDEYASFMKLRAKGEDEAKARLLGEVMKPIKREQEKWFKDERAKVREEVARQVNAMPMYRAYEWLGNGRWLGEGEPEGLEKLKLSKDILVQRYGTGVLDTLSAGRKPVYSPNGGVDPDDIAGWFGFDSGDEMVRAIERAPKRKEAIEAETDKVMRERHGDALNDGSIEAAALDAVHNDRRGEWIAAELKAVADIAGVNVALTAKQARATARETVSRLRVRDAIASNRFLAAERKAGEEAARLGAMLAREKVWLDAADRRMKARARAASKGRADVDQVNTAIDRRNAMLESKDASFVRDGKDRTSHIAGYNENVAKLIEAKRRQLINHALYMEARKVADEVEKAENYVARLNKKTTREKIAGAGRRENAQVDYLAAIDELLERYDFRKMSGAAEGRRGALNAFVEAMKANGRENELAIPDAVLTAASRKPYKTLPVEELRGVIASLKNLESAARRWDKLIDAQQQRELDAVVADIADAFDKNMPKREPGRVGTRAEAARNTGRQFLDIVLNAGTILREVDGFEDLGAAYRNIKSPIDDAMTRLISRKEKAATDLEALYSVYSKDERRRMAVREHVPDLGYALSKWERIAVALNTGNDGNFQRLTDRKVRGHLTEDQVTAVLATLDERDAKFVQSVWDYVGSFRDDIGARERRVTGVEPAWVEARPVTIAGKTLAGGYFPLKYDPRLSALSRDDEAQDIAQSLQAGRFGKAQTRNGHTKERAQSSGRAVELDMSVLHRHVNQVIYDLELSEPVANSWRILQDGRIRAAFMNAGRQPDFDALEIWLKDVAEGELRSANIVGRAARSLKSNFTAAKLAFNLGTVAVQLTGLSQTIVVVGKRDFAKGVKAAFRPGVRDEVAAKSPFMASRQTTFNKDIYDMFNDPKLGPIASRWSEGRNFIAGRLGFWLMTKVQWHLVDVPTWLAGYQQGLSKFGNDEAKAVAHADAILKRAQASGLFSDRSAVERGSVSNTARQNDVVRLFTALGSYMFAKFNVAYERTATARRKIRQEGVSARSAQEALSWTLDMAFLFTLEAVLAAALKGGLPGGDDEEDDGWLAFLAKETGFSIMATVPGLRDIAGPLQGFDGGGAYGAITKEIAAPFIQAGQGEVDKAFVKSVVSATGLVSGLPTTQLNRAVDAGWRQAEGEEVSPLEYLLGRFRK